MILHRNAGRSASPFMLMSARRPFFGDLLKRLAPDLLVSHFSTLGAPLAWQAGIPVVSYWHNCFVWMSEKREEDFRRNDLYVSHYVAVSQAVSRNFSERFGISAEQDHSDPKRGVY